MRVGAQGREVGQKAGGGTAKASGRARGVQVLAPGCGGLGVSAATRGGWGGGGRGGAGALLPLPESFG